MRVHKSLAQYIILLILLLQIPTFIYNVKLKELSSLFNHQKYSFNLDNIIHEHNKQNYLIFSSINTFCDNIGAANNSSYDDVKQKTFPVYINNELISFNYLTIDFKTISKSSLKIINDYPARI